MPVHRDSRNNRSPRRNFGRRPRLFALEAREITAPATLLQRTGAEEAEAFFSPLKAELTEDGADTKD